MNLITSNTQTMTSREIADLTDKNHPDVMRDIRAMYEGLEIDQKANLHFDNSGANGRTVHFYHLNKELTLTLVSGYNLKLRHAIVQRWQELETAQSPAIPQTYAEALQLAADQAKQLEAAKPAVEFVNKYVECTGNKGFREVCKLLKVKENAFRDFLKSKKIMYRLGGAWMAYGNHIDAGRFEVSTGQNGDHAFNQCKFTPKGVEWIAGEWAKAQIIEMEI